MEWVYNVDSIYVSIEYSGNIHRQNHREVGMTTNIAYPLPYTWLSLDRYAQIMGLSPAQFDTAYGGTIFPVKSQCDDVWWQHDWQDHDKVSREEVSIAIKGAEDELLAVIGYPLAPTWYPEEIQQYPRYYRNDVYGGTYDVRGQLKGLKVNHGKVIAGGIRAVSRVGAAAVAPLYYDLDGDGFFETARVSVATTLTDAREIKVYFAGMGGEQEWEIRPCRGKAISAGVFTVDFWTWQLVDPDLREVFPTDTDLDAIDISGNPPTNVVATIDVYQEYNDYTDISAQYVWEPQLLNCPYCSGAGCSACTLSAQDGCLHVRDAEVGWVVPDVATYESGWSTDSASICREPDFVKLWYYAGAMSDEYLKSISFDALSQFWAQTIAYMATARLERPLCTCGNTMALTESLREDMAVSSRGVSRLMDFDLLGNPFGTRKGEIMAWQRVSKIAPRLIGGCAL